MVEACLTPFPMPYKCRHFSAVVWFQDAWTVRPSDEGPFALQGDSGSLVVTEDGNYAIGIIFGVGGGGRGGGYGIVIPIDHVLGMFGGLQMVSGHGV